MVNEYSSLKKEFEFYLENQAELAKKFNGKYIVIKNQEVIGVFESEIEAIDKTSANHKLGTFLVQKCEPGKESYTQTYHSRVVFPIP
jgi:hypothetical protein